VQGDLQHWVPALNRFDSFFEERIKPRQDVGLQFADGEEAGEFPGAACLAILHATSAILDNCSNKQLYGSVEVRPGAIAARCRRGSDPGGQRCAAAGRHALTHRCCAAPQHLASLLAAPDHDVVEAALQTLAAYFKKTHHSSSRLNAHPELNARLVAMCKGWGGKEEVGGAALAPALPWIAYA
jgi:hypothetical protein